MFFFEELIFQSHHANSLSIYTFLSSFPIILPSPIFPSPSNLSLSPSLIPYVPFSISFPLHHSTSLSLFLHLLLIPLTSPAPYSSSLPVFFSSFPISFPSCLSFFSFILFLLSHCPYLFFLVLCLPNERLVVEHTNLLENNGREQPCASIGPMSQLGHGRVQRLTLILGPVVSVDYQLWKKGEKKSYTMKLII